RVHSKGTPCGYEHRHVVLEVTRVRIADHTVIGRNSEGVREGTRRIMAGCGMLAHSVALRIQADQVPASRHGPEQAVGVELHLSRLTRRIGAASIELGERTPTNGVSDGIELCERAHTIRTALRLRVID